MTIAEKLGIIQQDLIAPKNQYNSFGKYNYRSCEDILEGLKPCLKKVKAAITISDDIVLVGDRFYVKATATLWDAESDAKISNTAWARESEDKKGMDASQVTGATSSYARKYALNGLFAIDDVKDADTRDNRQKEAEEQKQAEVKAEKVASQKIDKTKVNALLSRCERDGVNPDKIASLYKVKTLSDLSERQYLNLHENWEKVKE